MGEHREKPTIFGPFPDADPLDTARLFLRTNRYQVDSEEVGPTPATLQLEPSLVQTPPEEPQDDVVPAEDEAEEAENVDAPDGEDDEDDAEDEDEGIAEEDEAASDEDGDDAVAVVERLDEIILKMTATRGQKWAGFTSSNMADLETTVELRVVENSIQLEYIVTTTGQLLNEDELAYWKREAKALEAFVTGGDLVSVVSDESTRATKARRELIGTGLWIAAIVFVIVFIGGVLFVRFA